MALPTINPREIYPCLSPAIPTPGLPDVSADGSGPELNEDVARPMLLLIISEALPSSCREKPDRLRWSVAKGRSLEMSQSGEAGGVMRIFLRLAAISLVVVPTVTVSQTVYRCTDEQGHPVFSQRPCGADAVEKELHPVPPVFSGETAPVEDYKALNQRMGQAATRRTLMVKIRNIERRIDALREDRDEKISAYRREMLRSAPNAAGVVRNQKYQSLIEAAQDRYKEEVADQERDLMVLRQELRSSE